MSTSKTFGDYFCNYCGSLLCLSSSQFVSRENTYQSASMQMQCIQCNQRYKKSKVLNNTGFVPLRQILKAEIIRDSEQWANASTTTERCPKCSNDKAYYLQVQTRSADEPMTNYYRCTKCTHNWSDR